MIRKYSILLFLFSFFITQVPLHAMVICIEADGSVEVETANNGVCTCDQAKVEDGDHCGSCVDIPFSIGNADYQNLRPSLKTSHLIKVPADADISVDMPDFKDESSGVSFLRHDYQKSNTLASIRTTILII